MDNQKIMEQILKSLKDIQESQVAFRGEMNDFRTEVNDRFDRIENQQMDFHGRLERLEAEFGKLRTDFTRLTKKVGYMDIKLDSLRSEINLANYAFDAAKQSQEQTTGFLISLRDNVRQLQARVKRLETERDS